ncbi:hypothetical protein RvY_14712 [Ramazzottius varieornatus]|uniref:Uncharacterized protein n=1 Tax=Ramazzottius varieornatus TaxID=947166 RepID=A0A1D1VSA4_RAMVA|nr:hypothetical protein RvY_14712 [Ramazzottius varieornatus]
MGPIETQYSLHVSNQVVSNQLSQGESVSPQLLERLRLAPSSTSTVLTSFLQTRSTCPLSSSEAHPVISQHCYGLQRGVLRLRKFARATSLHGGQLCRRFLRRERR